MHVLLPLLVLAAQSAAPAWLQAGYTRVDGRSVELAAVQRAGRWWLAAAGPRPVELTARLLVRPPADPEWSPDRLRRYGLRPQRRLGGRSPLWLFEADDPPAALQACAALVADEQVRWAVPDFRLPAELLHTASDPLAGEQWHLARPDGGHIGAETAWDWTTGAAEVVIAVIDTGVDTSHPDLAAARMVPGYDAVTGSADPSPSPLAIDHHGTACMGLAVAALDNDEGGAGVCPDCGWMAVRVFERGGYMNLSALVDGMMWAVDHGAWVLSNSWGIGQELVDSGVDVGPVREAVRYAVEQGRGGLGCAVLFATGNGNAEYEAQPIGTDELPAMAQTIAVGGCGPDGVVATYSDYGPAVSLLAPTWSGLAEAPRITSTDTAGAAGANQDGVNHRTDPGGQDVATGWPEPDAAGDYTRYFGGTSAATPIAAGVAGLVLAADPELDWRGVKDLLEQTAVQVGTEAEPPRVAAAYDAGGRDPRYGHGRVDAGRAVAAALFGRDQPDGQPCGLDLNCRGDCLREPAFGPEPTCASPCAGRADCERRHFCHAGHCYPDSTVELHGGCGRPASAGSPVAALALLGLLLLRWRRRLCHHRGCMRFSG